MCLKTLGASLIISISKFNYQDLYSFSTSIVNDYIDIILNSKNYHDNNSNAFTPPPPTTTTTTSRHTRKNSATTTYTSNCDDVNHNHYQLLCIPFNSTAAIITIQKSHHLMLIKTKL